MVIAIADCSLGKAIKFQLANVANILMCICFKTGENELHILMVGINVCTHTYIIFERERSRLGGNLNTNWYIENRSLIVKHEKTLTSATPKL